MSKKSEGDTTAKYRGQFASGPRREGRAGMIEEEEISRVFFKRYLEKLDKLRRKGGMMNFVISFFGLKIGDSEGSGRIGEDDKIGSICGICRRQDWYREEVCS